MKILKSACFCIPLMLLPGCGMLSRAITSGTHHPYHLHDPVSTKDGVTMCYLEFDDQGEPWRDDPDRKGDFIGERQLPRVVQEVKRIASSGPTRVLIFIHGWNNHADSANRDAFQATLGRLKNADTKTNVVGIYVAWRGTVGPFPVGVDVGNREAAAARIAGGPLLSSLREISEAARSKKANGETDDRVVLIGHSYGAKIAASMISNHLALMNPKEPKPLADLFILANTAESGMLARHSIGMMTDYRIKYPSVSGRVELPMVVVLGSDKDKPVRYLLPAWNHLTRDAASFAFPHKAGETSSDAQDKSIYRGMAQVDSIRSHTFQEQDILTASDAEKKMQEAATRAKPADRESEAWTSAMRVNYQYGQDWAAGRSGVLKFTLYPRAEAADFSVTETVVITREEASYNDTPFWIAKVPGYVVKGHGDIWNQNFYAILAGIEGASMPDRGKETPADAADVKMPTPSAKPTLQFTRKLQ